jgi:RNA polymerase sigma factor (TIGR02999 family)
MAAEGDITTLLFQMKQGDPHAESRLAGLVYTDLRRLARKLMSRERSDHTLEPTALVNEAYLRLLGEGDHGWNDRAHFFSVAARAMRHILVDYARSRNAAKRGPHMVKVTLEDAAAVTDRSEEILVLDEVLNRLASQDPRQARIVELRFFAGVMEEEIAQLLGISARTVTREWNFARAWLKRALSASASAAR